MEYTDDETVTNETELTAATDRITGTTGMNTGTTGMAELEFLLKGPMAYIKITESQAPTGFIRNLNPLWVKAVLDTNDGTWIPTTQEVVTDADTGTWTLTEGEAPDDITPTYEADGTISITIINRPTPPPGDDDDDDPPTDSPNNTPPPTSSTPPAGCNNPPSKNIKNIPKWVIVLTCCVLGKSHIRTIELSKLEQIARKPVAKMTALERWAVFFRYTPDKERLELVNEIIENEEGIALGAQVLLLILCTHLLLTSKP